MHVCTHLSAVLCCLSYGRALIKYTMLSALCWLQMQNIPSLYPTKKRISNIFSISLVWLRNGSTTLAAEACAIQCSIQRDRQRTYLCPCSLNERFNETIYLRRGYYSICSTTRTSTFKQNLKKHRS